MRITGQEGLAALRLRTVDSPAVTPLSFEVRFVGSNSLIKDSRAGVEF